MKKGFISLIFLTLSINIYSQVGINTETPKATLDIKVNETDESSNAEGILIPRISRYKAQNMLNVEESTLVYINNISNGSAVNSTEFVTEIGFYYFRDNKWVKINNSSNNIYENNGSLKDHRTINQRDKTINFLIEPTNGTSHFNIDGTTFNVDALNNKVGIGTLTPNAKLDIRTNPNSTTNPLDGMFGIGTTNLPANTAGAGAMRYNTLSGGVLEYSNGISWNTLTSTVQKSIVIAKKSTPQSFENRYEGGNVVVGWSEITDTGNDFNADTGIFTTPRNGNYLVSFSFNFRNGPISSNGSQVEAILGTSKGFEKKSVVSYPTGGNGNAGAVISFGMNLEAGELVFPIIYQTLGSTKELRIGTGGDDGFVNFSVIEL